jgi:hypothetical protein
MHPGASSSSIDAYRIEKERLEVTVTLVGSGELHGYIFLQPKVYGYASHSEPVALFNDRELVFPLELDNGDVMLLSKARVVDISGLPLAEEDELVRASSPMALVEVTLAGGLTRLGSMRLEVRADRPRLLDYLNDIHQRFLMLYSDNGVRLVNRELIERVRPLD